VILLYRVFRSNWYDKKFEDLTKEEKERVDKFEQKLKEEPFSGKPLDYKFFREKKFNGKRLLFLVYENLQAVFLVTITDKKIQQEVIDLIKKNLDNYKEVIERLVKDN